MEKHSRIEYARKILSYIGVFCFAIIGGMSLLSNNLEYDTITDSEELLIVTIILLVTSLITKISNVILLSLMGKTKKQKIIYAIHTFITTIILFDIMGILINNIFRTELLPTIILHIIL